MINPDNLLFVEEVYNQWTQDPNSVATEWREYFAAQEMSTNGVYPEYTELSSRFTLCCGPKSLFGRGA